MSWGIDFKSAEEVKEYIKNLGIEYRFGCFKEKKPEVCHLLGDYFESVDRDYEKAFKVYDNNCGESFARSCLKCGNYTATAKGGQKKDFGKALQYYEKSCELGESMGCFRAGILTAMLSSNNPGAKSMDKAISLFEKACEQKNHEACFHLSTMFMEGFEKFKVAKDMKRSFEYAVRACELDNMYACANLSLMYKKGDGVTADEKLSEKYKQKATDLNDDVVKNRQLTFQQGLNST